MRSASFHSGSERSSGAGFAESARYDGCGRPGRSVQGLLLDRRD